MKRRERQQKLHDSLINMLYAPPSPPPHRSEFDEQTLDLAREIASSDHHRISKFLPSVDVNCKLQLVSEQLIF